MKQNMIALANKYGFEVSRGCDGSFKQKYGTNLFAIIYNGKIIVDIALADESIKYIIALLLVHYKLEGLNNPNYHFEYISFRQIANEDPQIIKMANEMVDEEIKDNILLFRKKHNSN